MEIALPIILFIAGLILIIKGGDFFVDAASWIASAFKIPKFIIGATIVSLATTLPELLVSVFAAIKGETAMAIGNAVGSVTANIGLIMAISIIFLPSVINRKAFSFKAIIMAASAALLWIFSFNSTFTLFPSFLMLTVFVIFMIQNVQEAKNSLSENTKEKEKIQRKALLINILKFAIGAAAIVLGSDLLVDNGSLLAKLMGVSESIIALTIVAIGTSLPELVTTVTAIVKKESALSIGNIIGANIIDLTLILPVCSLISKGSLPISKQNIMLDLPMCLLVILIAIVPTLVSKKFTRAQGITLLTAYFAYLVILCSNILAF